MAVEAVLTIVDTLIQNIDKLLDSTEKIITGLADGLIDSLPLLTARVPEIVIRLAEELIKAIPDIIIFAVRFCEKTADSFINFDWSAMAEKVMSNIANALDNAQKQVQITLDNLFSGGELYGGDINNVKSTEFVQRYKEGAEELADVISGAEDSIKKAYSSGMETVTAMFRSGAEISSGENWLAAENERAANAQAVLAKYKDTAEEWAKAKAEASDIEADSAPDTGTDGVVNKAETLAEELEKLEHEYKIHKASEADYWAERKRLLELYRDDDSEEWNELYDKVTEHYEKLSETEAKAAEKAAKDSESALKQSIEDKFRELETDQLEKGYDDTWLLGRERAFIETLDHNSDTYKDYNLKLLKEEKKADDALLEEQEAAAEERKDALEKSCESLVKSRDSLADSLNISKDIFSSDENTDKRTGAKKKSRSIDTQDFEKKLAAKKKLTAKIAELLEKDVPDSLISELLKQDPEDALFYANQLLKDPKKLSKITSVFSEDEDVSNILANMVTEKSDEFDKPGTDAGNLFGESFSKAFQANWETAMQSVLGDEYLSSAALSVSAANSQAGKENISPVSYGGGSENDSSRTGAKRTAAGSGNPVYKVLDLNGGYIARVVREENKRLATAGGG